MPKGKEWKTWLQWYGVTGDSQSTTEGFRDYLKRFNRSSILVLGLCIHHHRKIAGRLQTLLNPAHDGDAVRGREIVGQHTDGLAAAAAQGAGKGVGMVPKLLCHSPDLLSRCSCHVLRKRRSEEHTS